VKIRNIVMGILFTVYAVGVGWYGHKYWVIKPVAVATIALTWPVWEAVSRSDLGASKIYPEYVFDLPKR